VSKQEAASSPEEKKAETHPTPRNDSCSCQRCGGKFEKPLFAVNNSSGVGEGYYACPFCLSKIGSAKEEVAESGAPQEAVQVQVPVEEELAEEAPVVEDVKKKYNIPDKIEIPPTVCKYHVGYLKKRPKNTPVPEECFTCVEMLDCMTR
jgi:hypothetical protein